MPVSISVDELAQLIGTPAAPTIVAVTRRERFLAEGRRIAGSVWRDHMKTADWGPELAARGPLVVYCAEGHNVSQLAAGRLQAAGIDARHLDGGIAAFAAGGGLVIGKSGPDVPMDLQKPTIWVTRRRPKIDRVACPWLIRRIIDPLAEFLFVDKECVVDIAAEVGGIPFDIDGVPYSHRGELCSFDTLLDEFGLDDATLSRLARIVRGADTARLDLEPEAAGLLAVSLGLSAMEDDDHAQLDKGMIIYDPLFAWLRKASDETHNWPAGKAK